MQTILIVDDEDEILGLMKDFLESDGFHVLTAKNGVRIDTRWLDIALVF